MSYSGAYQQAMVPLTEWTMGVQKGCAGVTQEQAKLPPGADSSKWEKSGPEPGYYKLPGREVFGYSSIDFAMNLVFQAIMMYVTFFYTDIFGLRVGDVALMFLLSRFFDALADPVMGPIAERMNSPRGKYRPWLIRGAIPFAILAVLTYTTPDFSYGLKLAWAYITYNLLNILFTVIIQPYGALSSVMTLDPAQRTKLQSTRMVSPNAVEWSSPSLFRC